MQKSPLLSVRNFGYVSLAVDTLGQTFLVWNLTKKQKRFLDLEISPLFCFWKYDLCERHLKRIHLTCFSCKVRRVVSGKLPLTFPVHVHQIWSIEKKSKIRKFLFKNALSFAEALS
jgi:hypothetical protein